MLIRLDFLKLETDHLVFFLGPGADFFQQLKLDILEALVKAFIFNHKKSFLHLLKATICLNLFKYISYMQSSKISIKRGNCLKR